MKSPLPNITDSLSNNDKAAFLKKINNIKTLRQDKTNLINHIKMKNTILSDTKLNEGRTRNKYLATADNTT